MNFFRVLLFLYPTAFRNEYGADLLADVQHRLQDAGSLLLRFLLWIELVVDFVINGIAAQLDILRQDSRYALRAFLRTPGFTLTAVGVAALGIGVNTAMFSLADHVLLRPLPYPGSDRLVKLWEDQTFKGIPRNEPSPPNYRDWKRLSQSFESMAAFRGLSVNVQGQGDPERLDGVAMNADMFPMIGARPLFGRLFTEADDRETAPGTMLLSYGLWKNRYGGNQSVIGSKIIVDDGAYTIIGVMPPDFFFPSRDIQFWAPMRFKVRDFADRQNNFLHVVAKLKPGISIDRAQAEMKLIAANLEREYPKENFQIGVSITFLRDNFSQRSRDMVRVLTTASACILLIVCMNLASLLTARSLSRSKEMAVRSALGAGRERMVRQTLTESFLLALAGGVLGILIANWTMPLLGRFVPDSLPIGSSLHLDGRVLFISLLISTLTGLGFGLLPAIRSGKRDGVDELRERSHTSTNRQSKLWHGIVVAEISACVVLVVCSGLLIRAFQRLQAIDPGFRAERVMTLRTSLPMPRYVNTADRVTFYSRVLSEVRRLPNVAAAGYVSFLPLVVRGGIHPVKVDGMPDDHKSFHDAYLRFVTSGYFDAIGIKLLEGRDIRESDTTGSEAVAVVSESFVQSHWPGQNPIGRKIQFANATRRVVGVVRTARFRDLERPGTPQIYLSCAQVDNGEYDWFAPKDLAVRVAGTGVLSDLAPLIRKIISNVDSAQPVSDVQTMQEIVDTETAPRRVQMWLTTAFASMAFLLAALGIHGILSFAVSQRAQEIGVRVALGASQAGILALVLRQASRVAIIGTASGLIFAFLAGHSMRSLLVGVPPADLPTFAAAAALCCAMTAIGVLIPAIRALRVDPITAIRSE